MRKFRYLIIAVVIIIDQLSKYVVSTKMYVSESFSVIEGFINITYVQNRGAAFSTFTGKELLLTVLPLLCILFSIWYLEYKKDAHYTLMAALILIISGGMGNLIDRVRLGYVIDMLDFHFWPVFNVADIAICLGSIFVIIYVFNFEGKNVRK